MEPSVSDPSLGRLVAYTITGQSYPLSTSDPYEIAHFLSQEGWDESALCHLRQQASDASRPWPLIPAPSMREGISAAQLLTLARKVIEIIGDGRNIQVRRPGKLSDRDRQLIADRPPHHGVVG